MTHSRGDSIKDLVSYQSNGDYVRYALASAGIPFTDEQVDEIYTFPSPAMAVDLIVSMYDQSQQFRESMEKLQALAGHAQEQMSEK